MGPAALQTGRFGLERCLVGDSCKNRDFRGVWKLLLGGTSEQGWSQGKGKSDISLPAFPEDTSVAHRCVANLRPVPQVEASGQLNGPFSPADRLCVTVSRVVSWVWYLAQIPQHFLIEKCSACSEEKAQCFLIEKGFFCHNASESTPIQLMCFVLVSQHKSLYKAEGFKVSLGLSLLYTEWKPPCLCLIGHPFGVSCLKVIDICLKFHIHRLLIYMSMELCFKWHYAYRLHFCVCQEMYLILHVILDSLRGYFHNESLFSILLLNSNYIYFLRQSLDPINVNFDVITANKIILKQ